MVDVPIVTRYLALWIQQEKHKCIWKNAEFLLCLDAGNHPIHPTGVVEHYHCDWWTKDPSPYFDASEMINDKTLPECMDIHRKYQNSWWRPKRGLAAMPSSHRQLAPTGASPQCNNCAAYRTVGMNTLQYLHRLRNEIHLHKSCYEYAQQNYGRRSYTYNRLHEEALLKEAKNPSAGYVASGLATTAAATAVGTPKIPEAVKESGRHKSAVLQLGELMIEHSKAEKERLEQSLSLKWTWGVDITPDDIANMFRAADREYAVPHSGYDCSLTRSLPGENSNTSLPLASPNKEKISSISTNEVPLISDKNLINEHFREYPLHRRLPPASEEEKNLISDSEDRTEACESYSRWPRLLPMPRLSKPAIASSRHLAPPATSIPAVPLLADADAMNVEPSLTTASSKAVDVPALSAADDSKASSNAATTSNSAGMPHPDAMRAFRLLQQRTRRQEEKVAMMKEVLEALRKFCKEGGQANGIPT